MLTRGKKLGKQQYLLHISSQYGELSPLTADIGSLVWGTPANFNRFHVLAWLLHQHRSMEVNQTLHDVWPSSALVHMYTLPGLLPPNGILTRAVQNSLPSKSCVVLYWQCYCTVLEQWASAKLYGVQQRAPPIIFGRVAIMLGIGPHSR